MRRAIRASGRWWVVAAVAGAALTGGRIGPAVAGPPDVSRVAFDVRATAAAYEELPGFQDTTLGARHEATLAEIVNPPADAHALAAAVDLGFIEAFSGPQGPRAEADTAVPNVPEEQTTRAGPATYEAAVDRTPAARARAVGGEGGGGPFSAGSQSSASRAAAEGGTLVATASAEVSDLVFGPLRVGSVRYDAAVTMTPLGVTDAGGTVEVSDATFAGFPVTIGPDGMRLDETAVPTAGLAAARTAFGDAMSSTGFSQVRVAEPTVTVSDDGRHVVVDGGGLYVVMSGTDPEGRRYALAYRFTGGTLDALVGAPLGDARPVPAPPPSTTTTTAALPPPSTTPAPAPRPAPAPTSAPAAAPPGTAAPPPPRTVEPAVLVGIRRPAVPDPDLPWRVAGGVLAAGSVAVALVGLGRHTPPGRRLARAADRLADRYLRG